jgi:hypothetical protein
VDDSAAAALARASISAIARPFCVNLAHSTAADDLRDIVLANAATGHDRDSIRRPFDQSAQTVRTGGGSCSAAAGQHSLDAQIDEHFQRCKSICNQLEGQMKPTGSPSAASMIARIAG